jgi:uncharacterized protein (TIGR00369 family)
MEFRQHGLSTTIGERIISSADGRARMELDVTDKVKNPGGFLHGGALATLVDSAGTVAIMAAPSNTEHKPGVTTDLNVSYLSATRDGTVTADARAVKVGRTLAFADVEVRRGDGTVVAVGRITKFMG